MLAMEKLVTLRNFHNIVAEVRSDEAAGTISRFTAEALDELIKVRRGYDELTTALETPELPQFVPEILGEARA